MRTALLTAFLFLSPLALAQDDATPEGEGTEAAAEEPGEEPTDDALPEVDVEKKIEVCRAHGLMDPCEVEGQIGLCQLEPCDRGWKDGAPRACKQCVPYAMKPAEEPAPAEPEPLATEDEEPKKKKGPRRRKTRDCGCNASAAPVSALALGLVLPVVARRRRE
ncbi:MAG: hypothetical protein KC912_24965 [Proteobacteria bacterium]|nr:hypothetical protein [Pseudomonadota bacterium]